MTQVSEVLEHDHEGHPHTRPDGDWKLGENCNPVHDRVIVQRRQADQRYVVDGIETQVQVPDQYKGKSPWCEVIAKGPKVTEVEIGDTVVVHTWAGEPIHHDEMPRLFVILEEDIEAVFGG
jgi:co-chaperonin GroES (HSP10)